MQSRRSTIQLVKVFVLAIATLAATGSVFAVNEIEVIYSADGKSDHVEFVNHQADVFISRPVGWDNVGLYIVQIHARSFGNRTSVDIGTIHVSDAKGINITVSLQDDFANNTLSSYALRNCAGIRLESDSNLTVYGRIYGDLTGDIYTVNPGDGPILSVDFWCIGSITAGTSIKAANIIAVRAHKIEGGVTIESTNGLNAKISTIRTGYSNNERAGVSPPFGGWPTMAEMDIGTSASPINLITPADVDITGSVISMDDLYVNLNIGGDTNILRNALSVSEISGFSDYSPGSLTHRLQVAGQTVTLGNIYASADNGGYLDTADSTLNINSSTADYAGNIASILGGGGANEVDFRGRLWFNAGIANAAVIRLHDAMDGELIFNAENNLRFWSASSNVLINGTNVSTDNPDYALTTSGGGTVGMVDGVGNNLGFHLHLEAADPATSAAISRAAWLAGTVSINLTFYGPVRLNGLNFHVDLQRWDDISGQWVAGAICNLPPVDPLNYELIASGTNTSLNVVKLTLCSTCGCTLPLGNYRIIERPGGLKSDLGLAQDPDVQPFDYRFTLTQ